MTPPRQSDRRDIPLHPTAPPYIPPLIESTSHTGTILPPASPTTACRSLVQSIDPSDSIVIVGFRQRHIAFTARLDLPPPATPVRETTSYLAGVVARQPIDAAVLVGYGPPERVEPLLLAAADALPIPVYDVLRVTDGRFRSCWCDDPQCCPPPGRPFDVSTSPVAAAATYAGAVVLPDRGVLAASVAPVDGATLARMRRATVRARRRLVRLASEAGAGTAATACSAAAAAAAERAVLAAGEEGLQEAERRHRDRGTLDDDEVAWLTVLLADDAVYDLALLAITDLGPHAALWTDITRRAAPELSAAPAGLLAFAAWRGGNGALASIAVERALDSDPADPMAALMHEILATATPPSILDGWPAAPGRPLARRRRRRPGKVRT